MRYKVEALIRVDGGRLMMWFGGGVENLTNAAAWRVVGPNGCEVAIYDNPTTAADVRNHLNSIIGV